MKRKLSAISKKINLADVFLECGVVFTVAQCLITFYLLYSCTENTYSKMMYLSELSFESAVRTLIITMIFYSIMLALNISKKNK